MSWGLLVVAEARHFNRANHSSQNMAISSVPLYQSIMESTALSFKAALLTPTESANAFHSTNLFLFFHVPPTTTSAM